MGDMLTFYQSKSTEYVWANQNEIQYPDENFAREIMQLFTIGTKRLNADGTSVLDAGGREVPVYNNDVIVELSRAWTGFGESCHIVINKRNLFAGNSNFFSFNDDCTSL